ncbi:MAG: DUF3419 family protein [Pseudomonadota bacterium]
MKAAQLDGRTIWYAASNEDGRSETRALEPGGRTILSITASGSRTFDLLLADPAHIVSIDQNPAQTAFAELLAAGYRTLDYRQFAAFTGLDNDQYAREVLFERIVKNLSPATRTFWSNNRRAIGAGLIYAGKWEGFLRTIHGLAGSRRRGIAARLMAAETVEEQYSLWRSEWTDRQWRGFLKLLSMRFLWRYVAREPGIAFVARDFDISAYVAARFDHAARTQLFRESPFAWLMMTGSYPDDVRPPYLSEAGFDAIKNRIDRVEFVTAPVQDYLRGTDAGRFDAVSLSDYSSYCDVDVQRGLWRDLARAMPRGGRVCERKFFNKSGTGLPGEFGFVRDLELEEMLFQQDRAYFYSFVVAEKA